MKSFIKIAPGQKAILKKKKKQAVNGIVSQLNSITVTLLPSIQRFWAAKCQAMLRRSMSLWCLHIQFH